MTYKQITQLPPLKMKLSSDHQMTKIQFGFMSMAGIVSFVHATLWSIRHGVTIALDIIQGLCPFPVWSANAAKYIKTCYQLLVNYRLGGDKKPSLQKIHNFCQNRFDSFNMWQPSKRRHVKLNGAPFVVIIVNFNPNNQANYRNMYSSCKTK